jgi:hypothetical protein
LITYELLLLSEFEADPALQRDRAALERAARHAARVDVLPAGETLHLLRLSIDLLSENR